MAVAIIVAWIVSLPSADPVPKGEERLQGGWTATACEVSKDAPAEVEKYADRIRKSIKDGKAQARFDAGKFTLALGERANEMSGKYTYDESRDPARLTLVTGWREHPQTPCIVRVE